MGTTDNIGTPKAQDLTAFQYARLGPFSFTIVDTAGAAVNLSGHAICFVVGDENTGARLWQVDNCPVSGASNHIVTVSQADTNMATAGRFVYVLRDTTDDAVLARGGLTIIAGPNQL